MAFDFNCPSASYVASSEVVKSNAIMFVGDVTEAMVTDGYFVDRER